MAEPVPLPPPGFDDLLVNQKINYVQSFGTELRPHPETVPVPDWHREIIDERLKNLEANPDAGDNWEVFRSDSARIRQPPLKRMSRRFIVRPLAEANLENAAQWYHEERPGLADGFSKMSIGRSCACASGRFNSPWWPAMCAERCCTPSRTPSIFGCLTR